MNNLFPLRTSAKNSKNFNHPAVSGIKSRTTRRIDRELAQGWTVSNIVWHLANCVKQLLIVYAMTLIA